MIAGRERQVHLDRADVGVGAGDQLTRLDAVIETERHPRQVLVDQVPQIELDGVRGAHQEQPRDVRGDARGHSECDDSQT